MSTSRFMEDRSGRTLRRLAELKRKHGDTIAKAQRYRESQSSWRAGRAATLGDQYQSIGQQHRTSGRASSGEFGSAARTASRRAMNAMTKTVEIADGSSDFPVLMVEAYGKGIMRSWKFARAVFEDVTGLKLSPETEDDEDS